MTSWSDPMTRVPIAFDTQPLDHEEARALFQDRLRVFALSTGLLGFGFYVLNLVMTFPGVTGEDGVVAVARTAMAMFHLLAVAVSASVWLLVRLRSWPLPVLRGLDAGAVTLSCACYGLMGATHAAGPAPGLSQTIGLFSAMLACTNVVLARAVIVPSSAARTVLLSVIAFLPLELLSGVHAFRGFTAGGDELLEAPVAMLSWATVAAVVATVGSRVIYGLRRETASIRRLGQYSLESKIGEGSMGIVYRAHHVLLRRPTAVKLLPPDRAGEENIARFEREVRLTAQLTHPNTVAVYDYGRTPQGMFYYAMEYLPGLDLAALVRDYGAQPPGRVIHLLRQVCGALAEAHAAGLVHRDIKPANIILTERGGEPDVVKVVDFGVVKTLDLEGAETTQASRSMITGTPSYLSPEAIKSGDLVDGRSDIYALGCVGYFLLTGHPVFDGSSIVEICAHHLHTPPQPPSRRSPAVPADLDAVILECLAKSPEERFIDAGALREALGQSSAEATWSRIDALAWWAARRSAAPPGSRPQTLPPEAQTMAVDLGGR